MSNPHYCYNTHFRHTELSSMSSHHSNFLPLRRKEWSAAAVDAQTQATKRKLKLLFLIFYYSIGCFRIRLVCFFYKLCIAVFVVLSSRFMRTGMQPCSERCMLSLAFWNRKNATEHHHGWDLGDGASSGNPLRSHLDTVLMCERTPGIKWTSVRIHCT